MAGFGKFSDGESKNLSPPMAKHPGIVLWTIGLGYGIFIDPLFRKSIYSNQWLFAMLYLVASALVLPVLFLVVPMGVSAALKERKTEGLPYLTYEEWAAKSRWAAREAERDTVQTRSDLQETLKSHDKLPETDYLTEEEMNGWELEYCYRETYLCERIAELNRKGTESQSELLTCSKNRERTERILLIALVSVVAIIVVLVRYVLRPW